MTHTEQLRAALKQILYCALDIEEAENIANAALAAAPTEQDRRAGYIEGLEAAAEHLDLLDLRGYAAEIRALADKPVAT